MIRITDAAHDAVRQVLQPGERAVDATTGNGHDTRFLAQLVGPTGRVFAFDIQASSRLAVKSLPEVTFFLSDHAEMGMRLPSECHGRIGAVMFNLGYLPGGDHAITTRTESSVSAIRVAATWLRPGGVLTIVAYSGHPGGAEETDAVQTVVWELGESGFAIREEKSPSGKRPGPRLFIVTKPETVISSVSTSGIV